jgi:hypothetical protein
VNDGSSDTDFSLDSSASESSSENSEDILESYDLGQLAFSNRVHSTRRDHFSTEARCTHPQLPGQETGKYGIISSHSRNYRCPVQRDRYINSKAKVYH